MSQVRISDEARKELKKQAAIEDRTMQEIVETLILKYTSKGGQWITKAVSEWRRK